MKKVDEFLKASLSRIGTIKVNNALNPLLWLDTALTVATLVSSAFLPHSHPVVWLMMVLLGGSVTATLLSFFIFMISDPDRLQSEEYQIKHLEIREQILRKSDTGPIMVPASDTIDDPVIIDSRPESTKGKK